MRVSPHGDRILVGQRSITGATKCNEESGDMACNPSLGDPLDPPYTAAATASSVGTIAMASQGQRSNV